MRKLSKVRESTLPYLASEGYEVSSNETPLYDYNCIAFAADDESQIWWPQDDSYWPVEPAEVTPDSFIKAFQTRGYKKCEDSSLEVGFQKIAIYVLHGKPTHAAKQTESGKWKSKLGAIWEDIEHNTLKAVEDHFCYGKAEIFMKREIKNEIGPSNR